LDFIAHKCRFVKKLLITVEEQTMLLL